MNFELNNKTIHLYRSDYEKILSQAKREFPLECCGIFGGLEKEKDVYIYRVYEMKNIDESSTHFSLDPKEQFDKVNKIIDEGYEWLGSYHSHPYTPSRPSEEDKKLAYDPALIYGIISLKGENPVLNFFEIDEDKKVKKYNLNIWEEESACERGE
ncbi:M67 family metallopeptidase [Natranaerofaba carboxydovora]|uniref:M67 family metallopeptidase n=1 Tax=Natranaerofaba carboxydovora TaxID=2742683 RepID=UPI001F139D49|nr:M67 family metallopeptidase [Natranaerofaba carboxydovora]UMZ72692.1 CysO-cysteine peptidase [Natranaerofaba carboxydovora]